MLKLYKTDINSLTNEDFISGFNSLPFVIKERIKSKNNPLSQKQSLAGYLLLKKGIYELYGKEQFDVEFLENGKPICDFCSFSISHSDNMAVCVFSDKRIGVDIQKIHEIAPKNHYPLFTKEETDFINSDPLMAGKRFFEVFTKKEALTKLYGEKLVNCNNLSTQNIDFKLFEENGFMLCIAEEIG